MTAKSSPSRREGRWWWGPRRHSSEWAAGPQSEKHSSGPPPLRWETPGPEEEGPSGLLQRPSPANRLCPGPECRLRRGRGAARRNRGPGATRTEPRCQPAPLGAIPRPLSSFRPCQKSSGFLGWRRAPLVTAPACPVCPCPRPLFALCLCLSSAWRDTAPKLRD